MSSPLFETSRLIIRKIEASDVEGMYALDSNPRVHEHLGNEPIQTLAQAEAIIAKVLAQYRDLKIARWALVEKSSGNFIGWTGFKLNLEPINDHVNFLDIGYRLREEYWGKGYASESAVACLDYAFNHWDYETIYGMAMDGNEASIKILNQKLGMRQTGTFFGHGSLCNFYEITKDEWLLNRD